MPTTLLRFYARFAKTLHNELEIGRVLVRQHLAAMFKGIVRVDAEDLLPLGTGFIGPAQMTETRLARAKYRYPDVASAGV